MTDSKIKTGTTCIGIKFKGGVMLAADNRVTSYKIVSDNFTKVFNLSKNIVSTVSGGVADAQRFIRHIQGELKLIELRSERTPLVKEAVMLLTNYQYATIRQTGGVVGMIVAGYDKTGTSIYDLGPDGTILENLDYVTSGSGSIYVDGTLSLEHNNNLSEKEALDLLERCFKTAFKHDNASGGGFIVKVVTKDGIREMTRKIVKTELVEEK